MSHVYFVINRSKGLFGKDKKEKPKMVGLTKLVIAHKTMLNYILN